MTSFNLNDLPAPNAVVQGLSASTQNSEEQKHSVLSAHAPAITPPRCHIKPLPADPSLLHKRAQGAQPHGTEHTEQRTLSGDTDSRLLKDGTMERTVFLSRMGSSKAFLLRTGSFFKDVHPEAPEKSTAADSQARKATTLRHSTAWTQMADETQTSRAPLCPPIPRGNFIEGRRLSLQKSCYSVSDSNRSPRSFWKFESRDRTNTAPALKSNN